MNLGFIGLGKMGIPMVKNLTKSGYKINVFDKNPKTLRKLSNLRIIKQNTVKDIGKTSNYIFLMVYPASEVFEIIFNEKTGLIKGIKDKEKTENYKKTIIIDGGNADFVNSEEISMRLARYGINYIDIGFSGGPREAEKGNLAAFVGGNEKLFKQVFPFLLALCNRDKISYTGKIGSGHFAKVISHNTSEYGIMGLLGEIGSLSHKVGNHKKIMAAVNNGLAETKLGEFYLKLKDKDIEDSGCKIDTTQNAAELALREANKYRIGVPLISLIYYLRKISQELYETDDISDRTRNDLISNLLYQIDMLIQEHRRTGTVRSMSIQAQLRTLFGRHKSYKRKEIK
jgi:2-hydroxy-3-oxopropionate reductase